jgi:hypothetical protein
MDTSIGRENLFDGTPIKKGTSVTDSDFRTRVA